MIDEGDRRPVAEREAERPAAPRIGRTGFTIGQLGCGELPRAPTRHRARSATSSRWDSRSWSGITPSRGTGATSTVCTRLDQKSLEASRAAAQAERGAEIAAASTDARNSPVTVGNRIETMEAELRRIGRELTGYTRNLSNGYEEVHEPATGRYAERLQIQQADLQDQANYWKEVRAKQAADGVPVFSAETISKGDYLYVCGFWRKEVRVSKKSVSCETGYSWTDRVQYHKITRHRTAAEVEAARLQQAAEGEE